MKRRMEPNEAFIRAHLPEEAADQSIDCFRKMYLDGLTVMSEGERGGPDQVLYQAESPEDLLYWELECVCSFIKEKNPPARKVWRWYREYAENGQWYYTEHRHYDYNAIEDARLYGFECTLRLLAYGLPQERLEKRIQYYVQLMNRWYTAAHWDYDRTRQCFIEISDSREHDRDDDPVEEPRPGTIIAVVD